MNQDWNPVKLTAANAVMQDLLDPIEDRNFAESKSIDDLDIVIDIGKVPIVRNLCELYQLKGVDIPPDMAIFRSYDIWIISYFINIRKVGAFRKLKQVELEIGYKSLLDGQKPSVTIIELMPKTKLTKLVDGKFQFSGSIDLNGQLGIPKGVSNIIEKSKFAALGGELEVTSETNAVCNIGFSVLTQDIVSYGMGNYAGGWVLDKTEETPLIGDQMLVQTILVPQDTLKVAYEARVSAVASGPFGMLPVRLESPWESAEVMLS